MLNYHITGIKTTNKIQQLQDFNTVCYEKVLHQVKRGQQVTEIGIDSNNTQRHKCIMFLYKISLLNYF